MEALDRRCRRQRTGGNDKLLPANRLVAHLDLVLVHKPGAAHIDADPGILEVLRVIVDGDLRHHPVLSLHNLGEVC